MNTKDRLSLFEKYAIQNGDAQKVVDYKTINETHDKLCRYIIIANGKYPAESFNAKMTLQEWHKGELKFPYQGDCI